jgi:glycosyltransferase involved in cell wall biosynthesis
VTLKGVDLLRRHNLARFDGHNSTAALVRDIDRHGRRRREAIRSRIGTLLTALGADAPEIGGRTKGATRRGIDALCVALQPLDHRRAWLMLAVLSGRLPQSEQVVTAVRRADADGMVSALRLAIWSGPLPRLLDSGPFPEVRVISNATLVDVDHTAQVNFATGIQRVTRESVRRWAQDRAVTLIGWHQGEAALRSLTPLEVRRACWGGPPVGEPEPGPVLVPVDCVYLLPELATETVRTDALRALAEHSANSLRVIGYDMVPITVPETCGPAMPAAFARNLAAVRYSATVATISEAAAVEYRGWTDMLPQIGLRGPRIVPCLLPNQPVPSSERSLVAAAERLLIGGLPMVLVVGSHEPRKNHLAVLHAAELCWREGLRFSMTFIGGNSWSGERFATALARLQRHGRPVETISAADDDLLWAGYRLARFTVFPSLNEGFGLPVVESLSCGTPVITSDFGSMREISAQGGARLVDPRDDHALAGAMRELLTDDDELARLSQEASRRPVRTWDTYASEVWDVLTA